MLYETCRLTSKKTENLLSIGVIGDATTSGTNVGHHGGHWQELAAIVSELFIHSEQAFVIGKVAQETGFSVVRAVHLAHIDKCRKCVHLLADGAGTKEVAVVARTTSSC